MSNGLTDTHLAIAVGLRDEIRNSSLIPSFTVDVTKNGLELRNFQGCIKISLYHYGIHIFKIGYAVDDAVYDYDDPDLIPTIIARILYLQHIEVHKANEKFRKEKASGKR